jgi:beta-glucosidase
VPVREIRLPILMTLAFATACGNSPSPKPVELTGGATSAGGQQSMGGASTVSGGTSASGGATASGGRSSTSSSSTATGAQSGGNAGIGGTTNRSSLSTGGTQSTTTTGTAGTASGGAKAAGGTSSPGGTSAQSTLRAGGTTSQSAGGSTSTGGSQTVAGSSAVGGQSTTGGGTAWVPSDACVQKASKLFEQLSPAQRIGQMTQADIGALTTATASSAFLGAVLSGGNADPPGSNSPAAWASLVSSYLNVGKSFSPHVGMLYGIDAIHGNNNVQDAVIFPHNIGLGASRNAQLVEDVTRITALEMLGVGVNWAFAPTVAAALDIRWGRTYEAFSSTPELAGELGPATVRALQNGKLGSAQSVLASAKHYAGDGATDNGTNAGDVTTLDEAAFRRLAIEPYRPSVEAGVGTIMVSYSSYQGTNMVAAKKWLTDVLKGEFGFQGFLVSDWDAVDRMAGTNYSDQVQTAINAGIDMVMISQGLGSHNISDFANTLSALVDAGSVPQERIKDAVSRILTIKCEMGLLDGDTTIDPALTAAVGSTEHRAVARDAVRQSMVLLKNDGVLPLSSTLTRIHVTGSGADSLAKQCGGWTLGWQGLTSDGATSTTTGTTVLAAVKKRFSGKSTTITSSSDGSGASGADRAIVVVGETPYAEGQGDNPNPTLTAADFAAIAAVKAAKVPFVVVLFSGRPLILTDGSGVSAVDQANAFMAAWLPGTEGDGIVDVLFGDYKPTGKLSFLWPKSLSQLPLDVGDGQTPLFDFGYGLTYP